MPVTVLKVSRLSSLLPWLCLLWASCQISMGEEGQPDRQLLLKSSFKHSQNRHILLSGHAPRLICLLVRRSSAAFLLHCCKWPSDLLSLRSQTGKFIASVHSNRHSALSTFGTKAIFLDTLCVWLDFLLALSYPVLISKSLIVFHVLINSNYLCVEEIIF